MSSSRRWGAVPQEFITQKPRSVIFEENHGSQSRVAESSREKLHETSDAYGRVIAQLCARHRVIVCKDALQWILQQRKKGGAERPWRSVGYFRTRSALLRVSATLCSRIDPAAVAILLALPDQVGGAA